MNTQAQDMNNQKQIVFLLANGFYEGTNVYCLDRMRTAGLDAISVGVSSKFIRGIHGINLQADVVLNQLKGASPCMAVIAGSEKHISRLLIDPRIKNLLMKAAQNEHFRIAWLSHDISPDQLGWLNLENPEHFIQQGHLSIDEFTTHLIDTIMG